MSEPKTWLVSKDKVGDKSAIADHIKDVVKLKASREIEAGVGGLLETPWFIEKHLDVVENRVHWILDNCPEAETVDRDEAIITVWTHDLGRVLGWDNLHHVVSAQKTRQWLIDNGLDEDTANRIYNANLRHRSRDNFEPEIPLEKVIASADALSHFDGSDTGTVEGFIKREGFYYQIWKSEIKAGKTDELLLPWSLKKMKADATKKQGFDRSRTRAQREYDFLEAHTSEILGMIRRQVSLENEN